MKTLPIAERIITRARFEKPYFIAEAGVNHEGCLETALKMVELAADSGLDAIKFQSYKAETLASKHSPSYWDRTKEPSSSQYELFKKFDGFGEEEYKLLAERAEKCGIDFMSTPFDQHSIDYLAPLMPAYKIASADITNLPFIRNIALKGKPILLSTGASTMAEIYQALDVIGKSGNPPVGLLHCVLCYPTPPELANLGMIDYMYSHFPEYVIGYSDHTPADVMSDVLTCAWFLGSNVIEKHFTLDKTLPGNDHYHGMDPEDAKKMVEKFAYYKTLMGSFEKHYIEGEESARRNARRSLVTTRTIKKGEKLGMEDLIAKRPAHGISPEYFNLVLGSELLSDVPEDHILRFEDLIMQGN